MNSQLSETGSGHAPIIPADILAGIYQRAAESHPADYSTQVYVITTQIEAWRKLQAMAPAPDVKQALCDAHAALCRLSDEDIDSIKALPAIANAARALAGESLITIESFLDSQFARCGLNADWSVPAWYVGKGKPNVGSGFYFCDNEDGSFSFVFRDFRPDGEQGGQPEITNLGTFDHDLLLTALVKGANE